ncbi:hypothetical protein METP3_02047 [Methanosarcinales archaeon]|jgi:bifunctional DNA-binding transcriptional regulator/antitoxin component of YhaV-PrlF toxin-antitoxin module|nr:hypothetical protein METP3_02047 [Methanosarcinales archaeon]
MGKKFTVKARAHHGTDSLDITIPTQVCKENKINEGDVFSLEITDEGKSTILKYTRIFENK